MNFVVRKERKKCSARSNQTCGERAPSIQLSDTACNPRKRDSRALNGSFQITIPRTCCTRPHRLAQGKEASSPPKQWKRVVCWLVASSRVWNASIQSITSALSVLNPCVDIFAHSCLDETLLTSSLPSTHIVSMVLAYVAVTGGWWWWPYGGLAHFINS